jgi:hypothetical protein
MIAKEAGFEYPNNLTAQFYEAICIKVKIMKKNILLIFVLFSLLSLVCFAATHKGEDLPQFELPNLITSVGQSADVQMASVLAKRAGLNSVLKKTATTQDLEGVKTLTLVLGASLKGLGAAGIDVDQEKERVRTLIAEAKKRDIPLLCLHLGGESRRGQLTDQLITEFLPFSQMAIIVKSGNFDGFFSKICDEKNIPLVEVEKTVDVLTPLKKAFQ